MKRKLILIVSLVAASVGFGAAVGQRPSIYPKIESHGKVVRLPDAVEQPRNASRICVDVTSDGPHDAINPGVAKLARFVNIYAGAGARPADVRITAVLHGKATTVAMTDQAYARRLGTQDNPNLPLLRALHVAGVESGRFFEEPSHVRKRLSRTARAD